MKNIRGYKVLCFVLVSILSISSFVGCAKDKEDTESWSLGDFTVVEGNEDTEGNEDNEGNIVNDNSNTDLTNSNKSSGQSGVTSKGEPGKTTNISSVELLKNMPSKLRGTTLTMFLWEDMKKTDYGNVIEEFEKRTGITFKTKIATKESYQTELAALISSGKSPDMIRAIYNQPSVIKNLQPIENTGFNFNDSAWDKNLMKDFTFNGKTYAMHVNKSYYQNICVMLYNKKALKKAEMQDPYQIWKKNPKDWTWDKVWSMCETFVSKNKNKEGYYGIQFGIEDAYLRCFNTGLFGYDSNAGKYVSYLNNSETVKRYTELMNAIDKKLANSVWDKNSFVMGYSLFAMTYSSALEANNNNFSQLAGNLGSVPIPTDSTTTPGFEYCGIGIPKGATNAAAVPYFVRFVFDPAIYNVDTFFKDDQAKEVSLELINRGKFCYNSGWSWASWNDMINGGSSQVKTVIDKYKPEIDDTVAVMNTELKSLAK